MIHQGMIKVLEDMLKELEAKLMNLKIMSFPLLAKTIDGRKFQMNKADGCKFGTSYNQRNFWYMTETINGKRIRIKKTEW